MSYNICIIVWQYLYHSPQSWTLYHSLTICCHLTSPSKPQITTFSFCSKYLETRPSLSHAEHSNKTRQIDSDIVHMWLCYLKKACLKYKDKILSNVLEIQWFFKIQFTESEKVFSFHPGHTKKGGWPGVGLDWSTGRGSTIHVLECSLQFTDPDINIVAKVKAIQQLVSQKVIEWRHFHFKL